MEANCKIYHYIFDTLNKIKLFQSTYFLIEIQDFEELGLRAKNDEQEKEFGLFLSSYVIKA